MLFNAFNNLKIVYKCFFLNNNCLENAIVGCKCQMSPAIKIAYN